MLSVNALDFMNYKNALKGNYRKGVHAFRCILENPTQAADFAANLGGVCVVFGVPIGQDDRNSQQLLALLQASSVIDQAALTWLSQWYADYADDWDTMAGDTARASAIAGDALIWRAVGSSPVGAGKVIAAIAGLSCQDYADMAAVAASSTAMAAVAASQTAMAAVIASSTALNAVVSSSTAMAAVAASSTAMAAVTASSTAMAAIEASSMAIAKYAASAAGLNPADYDDMTELAASSTAMAAVSGSAMARSTLTTSSVARAALKVSPLAVEVSLVSSDGQYWNSPGTKAMCGLILYTKAGNSDNAFTISKIDSTTLASSNSARNAATSGNTGYKDWLEAFPNNSWVLSSITFYAYYTTTKIKYIPC